MGKLSLGFKVILIICALVLGCSGAGRVYSLQSTRLPWDEARTHCQDCYTDLVTLTPENIQHVQTLVQNLTSGCWVGLRKTFTSSNSSRIWSRWANGDLLLFQNWYPGWPVFKPTGTPCCSSSTTTSPDVATSDITEFATQNVTDFSTVEEAASTDVTGFSTQNSTGLWNSTTEGPAPEDQCLQPSAESYDEYIEDSCVAMLSFGAWVEKNCLECLPYICYEERFIAKADVTGRTSENATLTWQSAPGDISHYHVEVKGGNETRQFQTNNVTYDLVNLTAGTHYTVQVFPVKCGRNLDAQEAEFYTKPNKVENLEVTNVTETSVSLSWNKPDGNVDFYVIEEQDGTQTNSSTQSKEVGGLTPGNFYKFTVFSRVLDNSTKSEEYSITTYAKPGKVSDLSVSDNTKHSLRLRWAPPEGNVSDFLVTALNDLNEVLEEVVVDWPQTEATLTKLPNGSVITLTVAARVDGAVEGDIVTTIDYTAPTEISGLVLETTKDSLTATWNPPAGTSTTFNVELQLEGKTEGKELNLTKPETFFGELKTAANYTVIVYSFSGHLQGPGVEQSKFTKPSPPTNAKVDSFNKTSITFTWTAPENTATANYFVSLNSSFWSQNWNDTVLDSTSYTFRNLTPGTKYDFKVRTEAGGDSSSPTPPLSQCTVAEKREISLSMLCSSAVPLLCDKNYTRKDVFEQLKEHFKKTFGDSVFWKLEKQEN